MTKQYNQLRENKVTPEKHFWNRRSFIQAMGLGSISLLPLSKSALAVQAGFPSKKNPDYNDSFDGLTKEELVTNYNNFYEFSTDKKEVAEICLLYTSPSPRD